ncbi:hypothetical protein GF325_02055, partial [Candidatus Bathyarchaeota archaeon]|nr:hypothetical protein [Candidatus Bathyarchaeota archaeon]
MNSTNVREIVERVLAGVNVDATRDSGIMFRPFLSWLEGNLDILDENDNPIHLSQREEISAELMNVEIVNSIVQFCKNKYITLHPDIWKVFNGVTTWRLNSKIIRNILP